MTRRERIEAAARHAGLESQTALAAALGIKQPSLHALLIEKSPMLEQLARIAEITGVSYEWLRTGDPMHAPVWADRVALLANAARELSRQDRNRLVAQMDNVLREADPIDIYNADDVSLVLEDLRTELDALEDLAQQQLHRCAAVRARIQGLVAKQLPVAVGGGTTPIPLQGDTPAQQDGQAQAVTPQPSPDAARIRQESDQRVLRDFMNE